MKTKQLWLKWLYMTALCAALGFLPETDVVILRALLMLAAIIFFIPGGLLLTKGNRKTVKRVILISSLSLALSTGLIIFNFATVLMPDAWGSVAHILLGVFTTPMLCSQNWALSLFGWACLLSGGLFMLPKKRKA